jgi:hypothetical protein
MANNLLNLFRDDFVTHFPFVVIPAEITVETLRRKSPFLFLTIMAATTFRNSILQRHLATEIQRRISARIVMSCEKNMDLLQGLLVHVAWYHYYFDPKKLDLPYVAVVRHAYSRSRPRQEPQREKGKAY